MNFLAPVFYFRLILQRKKSYLLPFLLILFFYDVAHFMNGVELKSFLISNLLLISTFMFVVTLHYFVATNESIARQFKFILLLNFLFTIVAIILYFTPYREMLWYIKKFTASVDKLPRLALFTYEASYYSLLFIPVAAWYLLGIFTGNQKKNTLTLLALVIIPLLLSLSLGVLAAFFLAFVVLCTLHSKLFVIRKRSLSLILLFMMTLLTGLIFLLIFYPSNPLFVRLMNIFSGVDTSANGRTYESFGIAFRVAAERSLTFGAGLGQIKILGPAIVNTYYWNWGWPDVIRIPNAMAETLAIFGFSGVLMRIMLEFYLFLRTRVWQNSYRLLLFLFIFIYQFTGSYITNIIEYTIWVFAFTPVFKEFDVNLLSKKI